MVGEMALWPRLQMKCLGPDLTTRPRAQSTNGEPRGATLGNKKAGLWFSQERKWTTSYPTHSLRPQIPAECQAAGQAAHQWSPVQGAAQSSHPTADTVRIQKMPYGLRSVPSTHENRISFPHAPGHHLHERGKKRDIRNSEHFSKKEKKNWVI